MSKRQPSGLTKLLDQRANLKQKMSELVMKAYQPSIVDVSGQTIYHKWVTPKAEAAFKRMEALLFMVNDKIKRQDELS